MIDNYEILLPVESYGLPSVPQPQRREPNASMGASDNVEADLASRYPTWQAGEHKYVAHHLREMQRLGASPMTEGLQTELKGFLAALHGNKAIRTPQLIAMLGSLGVDVSKISDRKALVMALGAKLRDTSTAAYRQGDADWQHVSDGGPGEAFWRHKGTGKDVLFRGYTRPVGQKGGEWVDAGADSYRQGNNWFNPSGGESLFSAERPEDLAPPVVEIASENVNGLQSMLDGDKDWSSGSASGLDHDSEMDNPDVGYQEPGNVDFLGSLGDDEFSEIANDGDGNDDGDGDNGNVNALDALGDDDEEIGKESDGPK